MSLKKAINAARLLGYPGGHPREGAAPIHGFSGGEILPGIPMSALAAEKPPISTPRPADNHECLWAGGGE